ncbi:MAG: PspC domain-containing protein [Epulopiscium sp.]|nr:PspC domain-containing protein [Candidatus Epulonipiscium sp.]
MKKKLYKSRDKKIDGVCSGIAEYFGMDPTLIRLIWVVMTFVGFSGVIAYIICMIVMPEAPVGYDPDKEIIIEDDRYNSN